VKPTQLVQPEHVQLEIACAVIVVDHQIEVIQVQVGKKFIMEVLESISLLITWEYY
jgi:hypothetical protein